MLLQRQHPSSPPRHGQQLRQAAPTLLRLLRPLGLRPAREALSLWAAMGAPDVPALFVGQRVWAPWLNDSNNIEGERWMAARVLGEGVPLRGSVRTYKLYYDIDAKIHHRGIPLTKGGHTMISTTNPL